MAHKVFGPAIVTLYFFLNSSNNNSFEKISGLNEQQSIISSGTGVVWPDYSGHQIGADSRAMLLNYQNGPFATNSQKNFKLLLNQTIKQ